MHSQFFCFLQEYRNVFFVEAAQNQSSADVHHAAESTHVVEQNVAVDVGKNQVENAADVVDYLTVAKEYFHICYAVQHGIMLGIFYAPLVNIVAYHVFSAQFGAGEGKYSRTRSSIQDALGSDRHLEQL